jgi:hypothetical protein
VLEQIGANVAAEGCAGSRWRCSREERREQMEVQQRGAQGADGGAAERWVTMALGGHLKAPEIQQIAHCLANQVASFTSP